MRWHAWLFTAIVLAAPKPIRADPAMAGRILTAPPDKPDPAARYLFYLHGKIIEDKGRKPHHPRFGVYAYDDVVRALAASGATVISEVRGPTNMDKYAAKVVDQIRALVAAGVALDHIAIIGFSKGGLIAQRIAAKAQLAIHYVLLAGCFGASNTNKPLHGKFLSLREKSDTMASSCTPLFKRAAKTATGREQVIAIGGAHGAFYRPHEAWLRPTLEHVGARAKGPP